MLEGLTIVVSFAKHAKEELLYVDPKEDPRNNGDKPGGDKVTSGSDKLEDAANESKPSGEDTEPNGEDKDDTHISTPLPPHPVAWSLTPEQQKPFRSILEVPNPKSSKNLKP
jgi:hypothetical protein